MDGLGDLQWYHGAQPTAWTTLWQAEIEGLRAALAFSPLPFARMFEHAVGKALLSIGNFIVKVPSLLGGVTK